ncbi:DUF1931 family protein [Saccharopolyspora sp. K220]|uniref:DUF1931 family protein n=1 Tax=Saccharopolyspora soli TaxID=2926618 RepID=UPI001F588B0A|nr:DUF1931 family protein [Saccharopolyspora soli]MCI2419294.1 DUF1931 family protein [Saccharopolyspora soli]
MRRNSTTSWVGNAAGRLTRTTTETAWKGTDMAVMGVTKFERFFRAVAGLRVDKNDLKRYNDFVNQKLYDLCLMGRNSATANSRDVMQVSDLPITKGLQESIQAFDELDEEIEVEPILEHLTAQPPLEVEFSEEARQRLPHVAGGISVALARTFKAIDPDVKNPGTAEWERVFLVFDLLL